MFQRIRIAIAKRYVNGYMLDSLGRRKASFSVVLRQVVDSVTILQTD